MKLFCDKKAAINISHNSVHHDQIKHIEVDRYFIKEKIEKGIICMSYVSTSEQAINLLTKSLARPISEKLIDKLEMKNLFSPT